MYFCRHFVFFLCHVSLMDRFFNCWFYNIYFFPRYCVRKMDSYVREFENLVNLDDFDILFIFFWILILVFSCNCEFSGMWVPHVRVLLFMENNYGNVKNVTLGPCDVIMMSAMPWQHRWAQSSMVRSTQHAREAGIVQIRAKASTGAELAA